MAGRYRGLWAAHASRVHGVVFVVDVTDRARIAVARDELHGVLQSRGTLNRYQTTLLKLLTVIILLCSVQSRWAAKIIAMCLLLFGVVAVGDSPLDWYRTHERIALNNHEFERIIGASNERSINTVCRKLGKMLPCLVSLASLINCVSFYGLPGMV